jgi:cell division protein FtsL
MIIAIVASGLILVSSILMWAYKAIELENNITELQRKLDRLQHGLNREEATRLDTDNDLYHLIQIHRHNKEEWTCRKE